MDIKNLRYILFLLDTKTKEHDGKIFCSYNDAYEYATNCINEKYSDKAIIGIFYLKNEEQQMNITMVETIGFIGDKKNVNQLNLFKNGTTNN